MIIELSTHFNEEEKNLLREYNDVDIKFFIESDNLSIGTGDNKAVDNPKRMIGFGGLYLLELEDEPDDWYMGQWENSYYNFWGRYGDLDSALKGL